MFFSLSRSLSHCSTEIQSKIIDCALWRIRLNNNKRRRRRRGERKTKISFIWEHQQWMESFEDCRMQSIEDQLLWLWLDNHQRQIESYERENNTSFTQRISHISQLHWSNKYTTTKKKKTEQSNIEHQGKAYSKNTRKIHQNRNQKLKIRFCYSDGGGESNGIRFFGVFRGERLAESVDWIDGEENVNELRLPVTVADRPFVGIVTDPLTDNEDILCSKPDSFFVNGKKDRRLQTQANNKQQSSRHFRG